MAALKQRFFKPETDIFGSHTFHVCKRYYSCGPDPGAIRADAFLMANWPNYLYTFPPPPIMSKKLAKIEEAGIMAIIIEPAGQRHRGGTG